MAQLVDELILRTFTNKMRYHGLGLRYNSYCNYVLYDTERSLADRIMDPPKSINRIPAQPIRTNIIKTGTRDVDRKELLKYSLELATEFDTARRVLLSSLMILSDREEKETKLINFNSKPGFVAIDESNGGMIMYGINNPMKSQTKIYIPLDENDDSSVHIGICFGNPKSEKILFYDVKENDPYDNPQSVYDRIEEIEEGSILEELFISKEDTDKHGDEDNDNEEEDADFFLKLKKDMYGLSGIQGYAYTNQDINYNVPTELLPLESVRHSKNIVLFSGVDMDNNYAVYALNIGKLVSSEGLKRRVWVAPWTKLLIGTEGELFTFEDKEKINVCEYDEIDGAWKVKRTLHVSVSDGVSNGISKLFTHKDIPIELLEEVITEAEKDVQENAIGRSQDEKGETNQET
ncbi:ORF92 [Chlamys acute necrobiotic virus]|nr:ORF92 [Chlamys acute necrobiotic virus]